MAKATSETWPEELLNVTIETDCEGTKAAVRRRIMSAVIKFWSISM